MKIRLATVGVVFFLLGYGASAETRQGSSHGYFHYPTCIPVHLHSSAALECKHVKKI